MCYSTWETKQVQVKVIVSNIIASSRASTGVPLVPGHGTSPCQNDKTNKQNEQSPHPFYLPLDSFLL